MYYIHIEMAAKVKLKWHSQLESVYNNGMNPNQRMYNLHIFR